MQYYEKAVKKISVLYRRLNAFCSGNYREARIKAGNGFEFAEKLHINDFHNAGDIHPAWLVGCMGRKTSHDEVYGGKFRLIRLAACFRYGNRRIGAPVRCFPYSSGAA